MSGLFQALEVGKRALLGHQVVLQTIGHNIANVNTPGYSRQRVRLTTSLPETSQYGPIGSGFQVDDIRHVRDLFLGQQYREAQKSLGRWNYKDKSLTQIESIFNEPKDNSVADALNAFWNDWSALATDAENNGHRASVVSSAEKLINGLGHLASSLKDLRAATDRDLASMTSEVNRLSNEIARLNQQIKASELGDNRANDLRDMRDKLTTDLANMIDVNVREKDNGASVVSMGAMVLVDGSSVIAIGAEAERQGTLLTHKLIWEGTEVELKNINGQLAGLMETRDVTIKNYLDQLNTLSRTLVEEVNALHVAGYGLDGSTGVAFFDPQYTDAADIRLNREVISDLNKIAVSDSSDRDERSNGRVASAIADLRNASLLSNNSATMNGFYNSLVGALGVESREAASFASNYELLTHQIDNQRQAVEGVSLDEEMTNMVRYQHAYDAAARVITAMDQALDTVINGMGIVGR